MGQRHDPDARTILTGGRNDASECSSLDALRAGPVAFRRPSADDCTMAIWIKLTISLALLAALFASVDWQSALVVLLKADATLLLVATIVLSTNMLISTWKWVILLTSRDVHCSFGEALRAYWIGSFFSNYLPTNVGGDVVRLFWMRHHGRTAAVAASIAVERLTGLVVVALLSALALANRGEYFGPPALRYALWAAIGGVAAIIAGIGAGASPFAALLQRGARRPGKPARLCAKLAKLIEAVGGYRDHVGSVVAALGLSCAFYAVLVLTSCLVLRSVGAAVPLSEVVYIVPVVTLLSAVPVAVNGIGVTESASVLFYVRVGFPANALVAAALLRRVVSLIVSLVGAVFWLLDPRRPAPADALAFGERRPGED
jgi:uncharacterized protein (TIRG00374 family)